MSEPLGTYYLGATVADVRILEVVRHAKMRAHIALGMYRGKREPRLQECHMTLVPPFHTTYGEATSINLACACAQSFPEHPLLSTQFSLGNMNTMDFGDSSVLHFHINVTSGEGAKIILLDYVRTIRDKVSLSTGFKWREVIPSTLHPHITILNIQKSKQGVNSLIWNDAIQEMVKENNNTRRTLPFLVAYPTLYAKYKNGWEPLSYDPCVSM